MELGPSKLTWVVKSGSRVMWECEYLGYFDYPPRGPWKPIHSEAGSASPWVQYGVPEQVLFGVTADVIF